MTAGLRQRLTGESTQAPLFKPELAQLSCGNSAMPAALPVHGSCFLREELGTRFPVHAGTLYAPAMPPATAGRAVTLLATCAALKAVTVFARAEGLGAGVHEPPPR